jgi:hypothetical protein
MARKCAHVVCYCAADAGEYCGTHCTQVALRSEKRPTCECGHVACEEPTMRVGGVYTTGS